MVALNGINACGGDVSDMFFLVKLILKVFAVKNAKSAVLFYKNPLVTTG